MSRVAGIGILSPKKPMVRIFADFALIGGAAALFLISLRTGIFGSSRVALDDPNFDYRDAEFSRFWLFDYYCYTKCRRSDGKRDARSRSVAPKHCWGLTLRPLDFKTANVQ